MASPSVDEISEGGVGASETTETGQEPMRAMSGSGRILDVMASTAVATIFHNAH
jgi:hypothetical protein